MRYFFALLIMVVLTAYAIYLAVSNGGKRLGAIGKVVDNVNKATDSLTPAEKRTYKQHKKEKKIKSKKKDEELSFAERFQPQMAYLQASRGDG